MTIILVYPPWAATSCTTTSARDQKTAYSRPPGTLVTPNDVPNGWVHEGNDVPRNLSDASYDYISLYGYNINVNVCYKNLYHEEEVTVLPPENVGAVFLYGPIGDPSQGSGSTGPSADENVIIRRFLVEAGVLREKYRDMSLAEMRGYVHGRVAC